MPVAAQFAPFHRLENVKTLLPTVLAIVLFANSAHAAEMAAEMVMDQADPTSNTSSNLTYSTELSVPESIATLEFRNQPGNTSADDLSLFGVISLGILGLFWIRRHTAEL